MKIGGVVVELQRIAKLNDGFPVSAFALKISAALDIAARSAC